MRRALLAAVFLAAFHPVMAAPATSSSNVPALQGLQRDLVVEGLEHPWGLAFLPDGRMLVTERPGRVRIIADGKLSEPLAGVPAVAAVGQGGLLDIVLDPDFAATGHVFFTLAEGTREANRTVVARAAFDGAGFTNWTTLWANPREKQGGQHFGARLLFLPDKTMLVSIGDGGNPPASLDGENIRNKAQDKAFAFGKLLRMDRDGKAPSDNPFAGEGGEAAFVWSLGHRNVQGLARDGETGAVFVNEHGALGGDELNRIEAGANYGWPLVTWSREYTGPEISSERMRAGFVDPVLVWQDATAPSGLAVYRGAAFPQFAGNIFSGGLMGQDVRRIVLNADGTVASEDAIRIGARVRDVREGPDGFLYVLTDERGSSGRLFRISPATPAP